MISIYVLFWSIFFAKLVIAKEDSFMNGWLKMEASVRMKPESFSSK